MRRPLVITGTNTHVGKTMLARLLLERARERGIRMAAMKPFCSGGREDAEIIHRLQTADLTLDEVNPFYFEAPVTPLVAARQEGRTITLQETLSKIQDIVTRDLPVIIEGAGGLLSPLGEGFDLLDLIKNLDGRVVVVAPNHLGTLNHVLLTARALQDPPAVVLMRPENPDTSSETNRDVLREYLPDSIVQELPRFAPSPSRDAAVNRDLDHLIDLILEA